MSLVKFFIILIVISVISIVFGYYLGNQNNSTRVLSSTSDSCSYPYINPNRCEPDVQQKNKEYIVLRNDLTKYISTQEQSGNASKIAVYFRDLQNGPIVNISAQESFSPASLLKVPLMINYLKRAETEPNLLNKTLQLVSDIPIVPQNIKPKRSLEKGQEYSIEEIIAVMITQSDNVSWELLLRYLGDTYTEEEFFNTLNDLGIVDPRKRNLEQVIAVQTYASLFRILYNSSYLTPEMSNKALETLSSSAFEDGIVAGVPDGIRVAHKFGEVKRGNEQQLHDCGIIYHTENPYLLCVMTKGKSIPALEEIIKHISHEVYSEVDNRHSN